MTVYLKRTLLNFIIIKIKIVLSTTEKAFIIFICVFYPSVVRADEPIRKVVNIPTKNRLKAEEIKKLSSSELKEYYQDSVIFNEFSKFLNRKEVPPTMLECENFLNSKGISYEAILGYNEEINAGYFGCAPINNKLYIFTENADKEFNIIKLVVKEK